MPSKTLSLIQNTLKIKSKLEDDINETPGNVGDLGGRIVTHWTFFVFSAGTITGLVTAVTAGILQTWPLLIIGGILCATNILGVGIQLSSANYLP